MQIASRTATTLLILASLALPVCADQGGGLPALTDRVARLEGNVSALTSSLSQLSTQVAQVNNAVTQVNQQFAQLGNVYSVTGLPVQISDSVWSMASLTVPPGDYVIQGSVDAINQVGVNDQAHICTIASTAGLPTLESAEGQVVPDVSQPGNRVTRLGLLDVQHFTVSTTMEISCVNVFPVGASLVAISFAPPKVSP